MNEENLKNYLSCVVEDSNMSIIFFFSFLMFEFTL